MEASRLTYERSQLAEEDCKLMLTWALSKQQIMHTHACVWSDVEVWRGPSGTSRRAKDYESPGKVCRPDA